MKRILKNINPDKRILRGSEWFLRKQTVQKKNKR